MKLWIKWAVVFGAVAILAWAINDALATRKARQQAVAAAAAASAVSVAELAPGDVLRVQVHELTQSLALSGSLRALDSALVKARVAGELQALHVREGDAVKAGQVVARIDPTESQARVQQAQQQAEAAKAQIDLAQRQFDNNQALVNQGFISKTALDNSLASLNAARASHLAAVATTDLARKGLADTVLTAPISGQVAQRLAQPGERVAVDARIIEIVNLARLELEAALAPADAALVRVGQGAWLNVEGASGPVVGPVAGRVVRISPSAQAGSRGVLVYVALDAQPGLRQGLYAQGALRVGAVQALALPLSAVRTDKPQPYVQVVEQGRIAYRPVSLGARGTAGDGGAGAQGQELVAVTGVVADTVVVTGALGRLREGTAVSLTAAAR